MKIDEGAQGLPFVKLQIKVFHVHDNMTLLTPTGMFESSCKLMQVVWQRQFFRQFTFFCVLCVIGKNNNNKKTSAFFKLYFYVWFWYLKGREGGLWEFFFLWGWGVGREGRKFKTDFVLLRTCLSNLSIMQMGKGDCLQDCLNAFN